MSEQDRTFMRNFGLLIIGLMVFTVVIIIVAMNLNRLADRPDNPDKLVALETLIAPVGEVYSGVAGQQALANQQAEQTPEQEAEPTAAFEGALDGEVIFNGVCSICHSAGVAGAPTMTQAAWEPRIGKGVETLISNAINGFQGEVGIMPAKGGRSDLSDEQVEATVRWMLENLN